MKRDLQLKKEERLCDWCDRITDHILYVMKYYGKHRQWWHYEVWDAWQYDCRIRKMY